MSAVVVLVTGAMGFAGRAGVPARGGQGVIAPSAPRAREDSAACAVLDGCGVRRPSLDTSAVGRLDGPALAAATVQAGAAVVAATGSG